jgi:hypothetical protein
MWANICSLNIGNFLFFSGWFSVYSSFVSPKSRLKGRFNSPKLNINPSVKSDGLSTGNGLNWNPGLLSRRSSGESVSSDHSFRRTNDRGLSSCETGISVNTKSGFGSSLIAKLGGGNGRFVFLPRLRTAFRE